MTGRRPVLHSPQNPQAKEHAPARRRKAGLVLAEGERLAREALLGCWPCERLYMEASWLDAASPPARKLLRLAAARRCPVEQVAPKVMEKLSACDTAPPAAVLCRPPETLARLPEQFPRRVLVLDGVQDPGNAGTMLRAADAFGFVTILTGDSVRPLNEKFLRASAGSCFHPGAFFHLPDRKVIAALLAGHHVYRLNPHAGKPLREARPAPDAALALLAGNEAHGLDPAAWPGTSPLRIDMRPGVESLNVAMSAAIALHHLGGTATP